jgi:hypothetical protein
MATSPNLASVGQSQRVDKRVRVDLHNPTPATRTLYDGIEGSQRPIIVRPGETAVNVEISEATAKELRDRTSARGRERADLTVHAANSYKVDDAKTASSDEDPDTED